ncbi:flagellar biosynthesis protein FlgN [Novosphingobium sp. M1R2S20]|uniref:Flagellar biosynthesis protein FlgN n=1 Tax=Novosphingobium rhizovicinum TaxID=3228928 RepID=A0ABV3R9F0_9SPHN
MASELIDTIRSLISLMREETEQLLSPGPTGDLEALAAAKARLVGWIEARTVQLQREQPDWRDALEPDDREALSEALVELCEVSAANGDALERQIRLSVEMLDAIAAEAKRLSGTRSQTYCARGGVSQVELPTPISINTQL